MAKLIAIAAVAQNGVIGKDQGLPWRLPKDTKFFKEQTMGHPIIMGRKSFEALGKPLPGRTNIVLTTNKEYQAEGASVFHDLQAALDKARNLDPERVYITGGAEIYALAMPRLTDLCLTHIEAEVEGDTFFPELQLADWKKTWSEHHSSDERHAYPMEFAWYERK